MTPIVFLDRDGTLIEEPEDFQVDSLDKLHFVRGVIPALLQLRDAGYVFVIVTNQDGLGTAAFPRAAFDVPHQRMLQVFASQGIVFRDVLIDTTYPEAHATTRKPGIGLVLPYIRDPSVDWQRSLMVGDRPTDMAFADNLSIPGFQLRTPQFGGQWDWSDIAHRIVRTPRTAFVKRHTQETQIEIAIDLDDSRDAVIHTGLAFFDHMLEQIAKHAGIGLTVQAQGDLAVDEHHTVEDTALVLGQALRQALGSKRGIGRYGFSLPMDESIASVVLDLSGRPYCAFVGSFQREKVGGLPTELVPHFFQSLCQTLGMTLHLRVQGDNDHHKIEACFKAFGRALRPAIRQDGSQLPSTKGAL